MIVAWGFGVVAIYFLVVQFKYDGLDSVCGCLLPPVVGVGVLVVFDAAYGYRL